MVHVLPQSPSKEQIKKKLQEEKEQKKMKQKIADDEKKKARENQHLQKQVNPILMAEVKKNMILPGIGQVQLDKTHHKPQSQTYQIHSSKANQE